MTDQSTPTRQSRSPLSPSQATGRLLISLAVGVIVFMWLTPASLDWHVRAIAGWDAASITILTLAWRIILRADASQTKRRAGEDDPGRHMVFVIALVASLVSLLAATFVLRTVRDFQPGLKTTWTLLTLAAVALSWAVTHTAYTLRYAHLYYRRSRKRDKSSPGGFEFCGGGEPSDIDFAYVAFTIGMCFQVSDVDVTTTWMRREVLIQSVLAFLYNTLILALALNLIISLLS